MCVAGLKKFKLFGACSLISDFRFGSERFRAFCGVRFVGRRKLKVRLIMETALRRRM